MAEIGTINRRQLFKLGAAAGAAATGALSPVLALPAVAAGPAKKAIFNVIDASHAILLAGAPATTYVRVDVLPSQFVGGIDMTFPDEHVVGPEAGGLWQIEQNQTTVIPIPATGLNYDLSNGGFAAVRAVSLDAGGNPGVVDVICYVALTDPDYMGSVSGEALVGTSFRVAVPSGLRNEVVTVCATPIGTGAVLVRDTRTNTPLFPATIVDSLHSVKVQTAVEVPTQIEAAFSGTGGVCSALISWGPRGNRRHMRVYPTRII